ncbi:MAG: eukaryotic-like serine/threonine-protein kinase [Solirubrobacteraceae bacterium]|jgi:serine/threonine-protein kinase|nr:eukaryotic-like serine/threonine-protein kinase [Solirubrobacteraceae bacterium]
MSTLVGMQLNGRYRLDAQIGTGGMSTVYRAFDAVLERRVAVKLMHREIAADTDQLERFRREARAVAQLSHPHIVGVIDAGEEDGRPYIVFEYVEGETLKDRIRRMGRLPVDEAIAYAIEISRALGAAHARHIVHRDVKPQNVLIDEEGSAKVTDFGIARSLDEEGLTAEGRVLGTTDYVSPEQALGHDVASGQCDIYSLGIVLFEMLTGDVPFHGENQVAVAMKHVREDLPDVQMRRPEVSAGLAAILDRMTDKHLEHRYPDAETLEADLEDALAAEAARSGRSTGEATAVIATLPERSRRHLPLRMRRRFPVFAVIAVLVAVGAAVAVLAIQGVDRTERGTGQGKVKAPPGTRVVSVKRTSAQDFDPLGDDDEHADQAHLAVDKDPGTSWTTESYRGGTLAGKRGDRDGVGLYVDAAPGVAATTIEIDTPKPGWQAEIHVAPDGAAPRGAPGPRSEWQQVGGGIVKHTRQRFTLRTGGKAYRYYLVWITKLPPAAERVEIADISLFRRAS